MNQIAQQLKEKNIAEYLIYMWQEEDLIRAIIVNRKRWRQMYCPLSGRTAACHARMVYQPDYDDGRGRSTGKGSSAD